MSLDRNIPAAALLALSATAAFADGAASGGSFKVVDNPGGGQFVYGPLTGSGTLPEDIIYMLRQVHGQFGARPKVGKFSESRDGTSIATFFTVSAANQGNKPMAGLLIVSMKRDGRASVAALYEDKTRFGASEPAIWTTSIAAARSSRTTCSTARWCATTSTPSAAR